MKKLILAALLLIAACSNPGGTQQSPQAIAQTTLQGVESAYQAAAQAELVYMRLPTCGTPAATTALCATAERRKQIKDYDMQAYAAIVAARAAADAASPALPAAVTAADSSVKTLSNSIPK